MILKKKYHLSDRLFTQREALTAKRPRVARGKKPSYAIVVRLLVLFS